MLLATPASAARPAEAQLTVSSSAALQARFQPLAAEVAAAEVAALIPPAAAEAAVAVARHRQVLARSELQAAAVVALL
jgi:hypothetical protein